MKIVFFIPAFLFFSLFVFSLSPLTYNPFYLSLSSSESNNEESEYEFPPATLPALDENFINSHKIDIIALSSMSGIAGIGLILFGIRDLFEQVESGFYSYKINKGIFLVSTGLIAGGISVAFLKSAIDTTVGADH